LQPSGSLPDLLKIGAEIGDVGCVNSSPIRLAHLVSKSSRRLQIVAEDVVGRRREDCLPAAHPFFDAGACDHHGVRCRSGRSSGCSLAALRPEVAPVEKNTF
jgi:hypothetical protein